MVERKQSCLDSIATVQREAAKAEVIDKTDGADGTSGRGRPKRCACAADEV